MAPPIVVLDKLDDMTTADPAAPMVVRLPARPLTLDDVAELAAADDAHRYELDEGNLVIMAPADADHADLIIRIGAWLHAQGYGDGRVLAVPGIRIRATKSGRCPDLMVVRRRLPRSTVWVEPVDVSLAIEIVSRGSENLDRVLKPIEYASVGIRQYWRVERDGEPTVHMYRLGTDERGTPAYVDHEEVLLDKLLDGEPPKL